jgi:hypothetical protein
MTRTALLQGQLILIVVSAAAIGGSCTSANPTTNAERLARGREIVERMSTKLGSAQALSVTTHEIRDEVTAHGESHPVSLVRETVVRRPNRLYSKVSGDRHNEVWYDGIGVTLVLHNDRVFGQARAPETLDKTLDAIHERYGVDTPFADYVYSSPAKALLSDTTTGGLVGQAIVDGEATDHLAFKDIGVNWQVWITASGDPVPRKAVVEFSDNKRVRKVAMTFKDWNFAPRISEHRFQPAVPPDYEGVALLQRARVLRNVPEGEQGATSTSGVIDKK